MRLHLSGQVCMGTLKVFEILIIMAIILANQQGKSFRAETKLLCYLVYFSISTVIGLSFVMVIVRNTPKDRKVFMEYFNCQSFAGCGSR